VAAAKAARLGAAGVLAGTVLLEAGTGAWAVMGVARGELAVQLAVQRAVQREVARSPTL